MIRDILKNFSLWVDGRGQAGNIEELVLPKLALKTEEHRVGGMDVPVELDMGMEKLESEFTLSSFDRSTLALFGLAAGASTQVTIRGAIVSDNGVTTAVKVNLRGKVKALDFGNWKAGDKATVKVSMSLRYYRLEHGFGVPVHEIDVDNFVRIINGIDQLAATRAAMGI